MKKVIAIYPGSFDPPTNGHLDLIERGSKIFDELVVAILRNAEKTPLFSVSERRRMLEELTADFKNVRVDTFDGLTVDYASKVKASAVLRGSYHLYQGIGGFIGNMVMGVVFVCLYRRWGRVGPLVVAHSLLDIGAFVGYALLAGKVGWLPTA